MNAVAIAVLLIPTALAAGEVTLDLPARPPNAPGGRAVAEAVARLPLAEREARILSEVKAGNVPDSWRRLVAVDVGRGGHRATFHVTPDYLAVGPDGDAFLVPLSPQAAQALADRLGCCLPTPQMVNDIHAAASVKLTPAPIAPTPEMTTVPVFLRHSDTVRAQMAGVRPGALVAGHKKDVVICRALPERPGKVAIYGWHRTDGRPIQPLYTGHTAAWVDYSHGVRLVRRALTVDGRATTVEAVLSDPALAPLLSSEGVITSTRYAATPPPPAITPAPGEAVDVLSLADGVRVAVDRPSPATGRPVLLVFYALPNGNTIEWTRGRALRPGDDWHFDIQHVAAQTRFLRAHVPDREVVVAYLENDLRSWPAWRKAHGDAGIPGLLDAVRRRFAGREVRWVLSGHSGGGSLVFGYLNSQDALPDDLERIAFLDANYAYETGRHRDKLAGWLRASERHYLVVLAYDDARALLNGKAFVSAEGGTWGRSHRMRDDLAGSFPFVSRTEAGLEQATALGGRVTFWLKENPDQAILHTVQVERNGFIEAVLAGTPAAGRGYQYFGTRAYDTYVEGGGAGLPR